MQWGLKAVVAVGQSGMSMSCAMDTESLWLQVLGMPPCFLWTYSTWSVQYSVTAVPFLHSESRDVE